MFFSLLVYKCDSSLFIADYHKYGLYSVLEKNLLFNAMCNLLSQLLNFLQPVSPIHAVSSFQFIRLRSMQNLNFYVFLIFIPNDKFSGIY